MRLLLAVMAMSMVAAAQPARVLPLTAEQAVELALAPEGALRLQLAGELMRQAEAQRGQARAALLPGVDGAYTFRSFTNNLEAFGVRIEIPGLPFRPPNFVGPIETSDWRVQFGWSVLDLSAWARYRAAGSRLKAAGYEEQAARNRAAAEVIRAYTNLQRAAQQVEAAWANVELAERLRRLAESRKQAGAGTGIEMARAGVQVANERTRLRAAEEERTAAELQLLRACAPEQGVGAPAEEPEAEDRGEGASHGPTSVEGRRGVEAPTPLIGRSRRDPEARGPGIERGRARGRDPPHLRRHAVGRWSANPCSRGAPPGAVRKSLQQGLSSPPTSAAPGLRLSVRETLWA